jgi:hypothetical protein
MLEHLQIANDIPTIQIEGTGSIRQITIGPNSRDSRALVFSHHDWFGADIVQDGLSRNGIPIQGEVLYYAAGANINRVDIVADGRAGASSVHCSGPSAVVH